MFLFTHIEKSAGTSFKQVLELTFLRYIHISKNPIGGNNKYNDLTIEQFNEVRKLFPTGIGGHSVRPYQDFIDFINNFSIFF